MTPDDALKQEAFWAARAVAVANPNAAMEADLRARQFNPRLVQPNRAARLQCPRCFVHFGTRSSLTPITSDSNDYDIARCDTCGTDVVLPL